MSFTETKHVICRNRNMIFKYDIAKALSDLLTNSSFDIQYFI